MYIFPTFADSSTGCYQRKQIIADFIKQNYQPEAIRANFCVYCKDCYNINTNSNRRKIKS